MLLIFTIIPVRTCCPACCPQVRHLSASSLRQQRLPPRRSSCVPPATRLSPAFPPPPPPSLVLLLCQRAASAVLIPATLVAFSEQGSMERLPMEKSVPLATNCDVLRDGHASVAADASVLHPVKEIQDKVRYVSVAYCWLLWSWSVSVSRRDCYLLSASALGCCPWRIMDCEVLCVRTSWTVPCSNPLRLEHGELTDESLRTTISAAPLPLLPGATLALCVCTACVLVYCFLSLSGTALAILLVVSSSFLRLVGTCSGSLTRSTRSGKCWQPRMVPRCRCR